MNATHYDFFHLITDNESAEVRRFITTHELTGLVNFRNVAYDSHAEALRQLCDGALVVPTLVVEDRRVLSGKSTILEFLKSKLSA
ncbi:MAG: hypothetical protein NDI61_14005 [Bdellovibrionaceae bacterium]|nr:hypothetical protein [Pseudobdellovibrionaceae bacterium]